MQNCSVAPTGLPVISPAGTNGKTPPNDFTSFFQANFQKIHITSVSVSGQITCSLFIFKICQTIAGLIMNQSISRDFFVFWISFLAGTGFWHLVQLWGRPDAQPVSGILIHAGQPEGHVLTRRGHHHVLVFGSCHFDRTSNDKFCVEFWMFVIVMFFNPSRVLKFGAPLRVP